MACLEEVGLARAENGIAMANCNVKNLYFENKEAGHGRDNDLLQTAEDYLAPAIISLKKQYKTEEAWLEFYTSASDQPAEEKHFVEDHFVQPELHNIHRTSLQVEDGEPVSLKEAFDPRHLQVLIRGEAGFGKSTLCTKVCLEWANNTENSVIPVEGKILIMYRLKLLRKGTNLRDEIIKFFHSHSNLPEDELERTEEAMDSVKTSIVLLLDGYDELDEEHRCQLKNMLCKSENKQDLFRSTFIIVTTRNLDDKELFKSFGKLFQISGLSKQNRDLFIDKYFHGTERQGEALKNQVDNLAIIKPDAISPFLLYLFCFLRSELDLDHLELDLEKSLPNVAYLLAVRCNATEKYCYSKEELLEKLNKLAELLIRSRITQTNVFLEKQLQDELGNDFKFIIRCGFFKPLNCSKEKAYVLAHSLFQDYMPIQIQIATEPQVFRRARTHSGHLGIDFTGSVIQLDSSTLGKTSYVTLRNIQDIIYYDENQEKHYMMLREDEDPDKMRRISEMNLECEC